MKIDNQCGVYIKHISDALQRDCNNALKATGLTMSQLTALHHLEDAPDGALPLKELERRLQVAQSTAAGIISRLEQKGLAKGNTDSTDRRIKIVQITDAGRACFAKALVYADNSETYLLSALTKEEQLLFNLLLKKVSENL